MKVYDIANTQVVKVYDIANTQGVKVYDIANTQGVKELVILDSGHYQVWFNQTNTKCDFLLV